MKRTVAVSVLSLAVVGVSLIGFAPTSTSVDREPDVVQFSRVYRGKVVALKACGGSDCVQGVPEELTFELPQGIGRVDLEVLLAIEYRTSRGDPAAVVMWLERPDRRRHRMSPGALTFRAGSTTTATAHWLERGVTVTDGTYEVSWRLGQGPGATIPFDIRASEAILVVQATAR